MSSYATSADFVLYGLPQAAIPSSTIDTDLQAYLDGASSEIDDYLTDRYTLPLVAQGTPAVFPVQLRQKACQIAQWNMLAVRGFNPEVGSHVVVRQRYEDAIAWCREIAMNKHGIAGVVDSSPAVPGPGGSSSPGGPFVVQTQRGLGPAGPGFVVSATPRTRGW